MHRKRKKRKETYTDYKKQKYFVCYPLENHFWPIAAVRQHTQNRIAAKYRHSQNITTLCTLGLRSITHISVLYRP